MPKLIYDDGCCSPEYAKWYHAYYSYKSWVDSCNACISKVKKIRQDTLDLAIQLFPCCSANPNRSKGCTWLETLIADVGYNDILIEAELAYGVEVLACLAVFALPLKIEKDLVEAAWQAYLACRNSSGCKEPSTIPIIPPQAPQQPPTGQDPPKNPFIRE